MSLEEENIDRIVQLDIEVEGLTEEELEEFGVDIVSLVEEPAIGVDFMAFSDADTVDITPYYEFIDPRSGESEDAFISRCMSSGKMQAEFPDEDQRLAVCYNYYEGDLDDACIPGYKAIGVKKKNGRTVPNCVPIENEEEFASYTDYPQAASNNAKRALKWAEENGWGSCGTPVGKRRANQLAKRQPISEETIARMSAFRRQQQNKNTPYGEGCGGLMWDAWGGDAGINWAERKLKQIRKEKDKASHHDSGSYNYSETQEDAIIAYASEFGYELTENDVIVDLNKKEFATVTQTVEAIRGLDILKRLNVKEQEAQTFWRYVGPPAQRKFCKAMTNLSKAGKIFSQDDIEKMDGLNKQFAKRGQSQYSIFKYKGGKNCKHYWEKLSVFKNESGQKIVIAGQPTNRTQDTATTAWANLSAKKCEHNFSIDDDKRIVTGPLMIPNKMILRRDDEGKPYYIFFKKETIKKMAEKFLKLGKQNNTDIQHDNQVVTENTLLESWISEDKMYDKAYKMGFALPMGTWYVSYKINNEETWQKIKNNELKGFSLAGPFIEKLSSEGLHNQKLSAIMNILEQVDDE